VAIDDDETLRTAGPPAADKALAARQAKAAPAASGKSGTSGKVEEVKVDKLKSA
jgi:hypothetical protein